jgi:hypothetical protein
MAPPFRRGDMVWSYFPFAETPDIPARTRHAAIIIGAFSATEAFRMLGHPVPAYGAAVAVYTSSQVKKFGGDLPIGIIQVSLDRARRNKNILHRYAGPGISAIRIIVLKRQYPSNTNLGITYGRGRCPTGLSIRTSGGSRECGTPSVVGHEPIAHLNACPEHGEDAIDASKAEPFDPSRKHLGYVRAFAVGLIGQLGVGHSGL